MITLALALTLLQGAPQDSATAGARVESLLASGNVNAALALATKLVGRRPRDPAAHLLLGRVNYARPIIGRFPALEEFRAAARLAPRDPEPWYWQMKVGFYLRSDDGEIIARDALLGLFAVTPDYKDAWDRFGDVFHNDDIWRRAERALARHGDNPAALEHRAELLIALRQPEAADSLLERRSATAHTCLLRAEANFLAGRSAAGFAWHDSALAHADDDSTDALWDEAWLIASPDEALRHAALGPGERAAFYRRFWDQRDPDLLTPQNERVAEHYARVAESRRMYRLLHPQRTVYHSPVARSLAFALRRRQQAEDVDTSTARFPGPVTERLFLASGLGLGDERMLQDTAMPMAFRAGLTAEGLVFLRHGTPDAQAFCISDVLHGVTVMRDTLCTNFIDEESWVYFTPEGPLSIRFGGGEYFAPISSAQTRSANILLRTDRTTLPAPLKAYAWTATFMAGELGLTDVYYKAGGDSAAVALWSADGEQRIAGRGLLYLAVIPGHYDLGLDVDSGGALGRIRRAVQVPYFSGTDFGLSSLVIAPLGSAAAPFDREETLRAMPADLTYSAGTPLAAYLEIYGLAADANNRARFHVRYSFAPVRSALARFFGAGGRPVVFEFDRVAPPTFARATEQLVIEPGRLPPGRYRVTVAVTDLTRNVKSEAVALDIAIR
ncbi:MAG TPA: GWxTD domain-containing protein [Gemmatimonadales bacterium]|nr:GWxTD domain-containing protein [Gemmatimonadales bacterium]